MRAIAFGAAAKPGQETLGAHARRHRITRQGLQLGGQLIAAGFRDAQGVAESAGIGAEQARHVRSRFQVVLPVGEEVGGDGAQGAVVADGGHDIGQGLLGAGGIVDVVGRDDLQLERLGQVDQGGDALLVIGAAVVVQLDEEGAGVEAGGITRGDGPGGVPAGAFQGARDFAFAPAGEGDQPGGAPGELLEMQQAFALGRLMLGLGDQPAEVLPARFVGDEEGEGVPLTPGPRERFTSPPNPPLHCNGEGGFFFRRLGFYGEFGAEDGLDVEGLRRLLEADRAVDIVVVGEGEAGQAQASGFGHEALRRRCPAQQAVGGVGAEFDVGGVGHVLTTESAEGAEIILPAQHRKGRATGSPVRAWGMM